MENFTSFLKKALQSEELTAITFNTAVSTSELNNPYNHKSLKFIAEKQIQLNLFNEAYNTLRKITEWRSEPEYRRFYALVDLAAKYSIEKYFREAIDIAKKVTKEDVKNQLFDVLVDRQISAKFFINEFEMVFHSCRGYWNWEFQLGRIEQKALRGAFKKAITLTEEIDESFHDFNKCKAYVFIGIQQILKGKNKKGEENIKKGIEMGFKQNKAHEHWEYIVKLLVEHNYIDMAGWIAGEIDDKDDDCPMLSGFIIEKLAETSNDIWGRYQTNEYTRSHIIPRIAIKYAKAGDYKSAIHWAENLISDISDKLFHSRSDLLVKIANIQSKNGLHSEALITLKKAKYYTSGKYNLINLIIKRQADAGLFDQDQASDTLGTLISHFINNHQSDPMDNKGNIDHPDCADLLVYIAERKSDQKFLKEVQLIISNAKFDGFDLLHKGKLISKIAKAYAQFNLDISEKYFNEAISLIKKSNHPFTIQGLVDIAKIQYEKGLKKNGIKTFYLAYTLSKEDIEFDDVIEKMASVGLFTFAIQLVKHLEISKKEYFLSIPSPLEEIAKAQAKVAFENLS